jgi:hypothetical protein
MATIIPMPARGDRAVPRFDPKQPRGLRRYFTDLEFHFNRANVTHDGEKKQHATRYVDVDTSELWESLQEFTDAALPYADFVKTVHSLYPGSEEERKWSVADMDKLVGERSRLGILSLADLGEYYRQFLAITSFLISKQRLSEDEQSRAFVRGFQSDLWVRVSQRLQLKLPDHFPDDPYPLDSIHEAALFALHGTSSTLLASVSPNTATHSSAPQNAKSDNANVKKEDIAAILERVESYIKMLTEQQQHQHHNHDHRGDPSNRGACNFCGSFEHFMRDCKVLADYIGAGKCIRNVEGKVVLPNGMFLPRDIKGDKFQTRFDEFHRRFPGQLATGQLMLGVLSQGISDPVAPARLTMATRTTHPDLFAKETPLVAPLTTQERIDSLERELFQLRGRKVDPPTQPRHSRRQERSPSPQPSTNEAENPPKAKQRLVPEVVIPQQPKPSETTVAEPPIHPFAGVRDATYAPPADRNFAALPKPNPVKKIEPAYRSLPPIHDKKVATDVYDRAMSTQVTLTQRELLSLSPEVRTQVRDAISTKRIPNKDETKEIHTLAEDDSLPYALDDLGPDEEDEPAPISTFIQSVKSLAPPPPGALIVPDPYETYLNSLPHGQKPDQLVVAKESSALRAIHPLVDNQQRIEGIIDPGSQIIAMSEEVCMDLALIYDPEIILNMQSANGEIDKSLGLARNVPLQIGDITLYVQIHVIRSPAYDILLGRPFDILTESVVRNFANEDQTLTIYDPNSGRRATVPTLPRGSLQYRRQGSFRKR